MTQIYGTMTRSNGRPVTFPKAGDRRPSQNSDQSVEKDCVQLQVPSQMLQSAAFRQKVAGYADHGMRVQVEFLPDAPAPQPTPPSEPGHNFASRTGGLIGAVSGATMGVVGALSLGVLFFGGGLGPVMEMATTHGALSLQALASAAPCTIVAGAVAAVVGTDGGWKLGSRVGKALGKIAGGQAAPQETTVETGKSKLPLGIVGSAAMIVMGPVSTAVGGALLGATLSSTGHLFSSAISTTQAFTPAMAAATAMTAAVGAALGILGNSSISQSIAKALGLNKEQAK